MEFRGTSNPEMYLISFSSADTFPMSGTGGDFVTSFLGSYNLITRTRIANIVHQTEGVVYADIIATSPKVIVSFGYEALNHFLGKGKSFNRVYDTDINGVKFKIIILESPYTVTQHLDNTEKVNAFAKGLFTAARIADGTYVDVLASKRILNAHSFEEFRDLYEKYLPNDDDIAYDIETNARPALFRRSKIIGFSISNKTTGIYTSIDSLDFHMSQEEEDKIWNYTINEIFEKKNKLIIHNTMYERPYTLYCKHYEIKFDKADDTLVMSRLLRNPKEPANLKYQAQTVLEYPDWETGLSKYINSVLFIINRLGLGPDKLQPLFYKLKTGTPLFELVQQQEFEKLDTKDKDALSRALDNIYAVMSEVYSEDEIKHLDTLLSSVILDIVDKGGIEDGTLPYNYIPDRVLSQYGAVDSLATYDLRDYFFDLMDKNSTETVDLHLGYHNWMEHMYLAYIMERNGLYWDEKSVSRDKPILLQKSLESLKTVLLSPCFEPYIYQSCEKTYRPILLSDYFPSIASTQGFLVEYNRTTKKYAVKYQGKRTTKDRIDEIIIPQNFAKEYEKKVKEFFYEEVNNSTDVEQLQKLFNPASPDDSSAIARAIFTTPNVMLSARISKLHLLSSSELFKATKETLTDIEKKFLDLASWCYDESKLKEKFPDNWSAVRKQFFEGFISLFKTYRKVVTNPDIKRILYERNPMPMETFDDESVIAVYDALLIQGVNQDDESTWTEEFRWLMNFRLFKKYMKLVTSYIDGTVGHKSVAVVKKADLNSKCTERLRKFGSGVSDDEAYLMNAEWFPNTAETGRWRSAQHTVPANSQIKKYYTSRFKGGTMLMPDYAQMEVRALAAIAHDENMLELFRSGKDFHTETAKKIFRKEEVTPAERKFSKGATFSLLYGSSVKSFAKSYCEGDEAYAQTIFDGFFAAYPEVQKWVEARHQEAQRTGQVSLELAGRIIKLGPDDPSGGLLRRAQNYPIQGTSADLTGCVAWDIQNFFETEHLDSLIVMYVHDSIEVDVPPFELIKVVTNLKDILVESPLKRMGLPAKADVALGYSLGHEIDMKDIETNEELTECTMSLKGYKDEIEETAANWKTVYSVVEITDAEWKDERVSMGELFMPKKAYTSTIGTVRQKGTCKVHIKY